MPIFTWRNSYNTGIDVVDEQHRGLVEMINRLDECIHYGSEDTELETLFDDLVAYTREHFATEEKMMADAVFNVDEFHAHKAKHDEFVKKIADVKSNHDAGAVGLTSEVMQFVVNWLIEHIGGTDRKMAAMLGYQREDGAPHMVEVDSSGQQGLVSALQESQARFRDLADSLPAFVWMSDLQYRRQYSNACWQDVTGLDVRALRSQWADCVHPDDRETVTERIKDAHDKRSGCDIEYRLKHSDGEYSWIHESIVPRYLNNQEFLGLVGCGFDVSAEKQAQAVIENANENLEREVAARTRDLVAANEELRTAQSNLLQAEKMKSIGQLAAGVAHEINTPSQYVGDNTRFLQDAFVDISTMIDALLSLTSETEGSLSGAEVRKALEDADVAYLQREIPRAMEQSLEGVERVTKIVSALKDFARPVHEKTEVDLNQAIENTVTVATNAWVDVANVELALDPELPNVLCRPTDFNQVMLNILVNAAHAVSGVVEERGKGTISVVTRQIDGHAEIRVADTGCGMTEEIKAQVFDPFFTTRDVGEGMGQGLAVAYTVVVDKHGGTIGVESEPGNGSCFTIRLPIQEAA